MSYFRSHPLASALISGAVFCSWLVVFDWYKSPQLVVPAITALQAPSLDGDISDDVWALAQPVDVLTRHGANFGGSGETTVVVRAVHDSQYAYIALEWDDPTRSLEYMPLYKDGDGWHSLQASANTANELHFFDDRIAIMLAPPGVQLIGGAIHLGKRPLSEAPASMTGRGLHYTAAGKMVDLWIWHAALGALTDRVQDDYLGPPLPFSAEQMAGQERYLGGIGEDDPSRPVGTKNFAPEPGADAGEVLPLTLPATGPVTTDQISAGADVSDPPEQDQLWAIRYSQARPYSPGEDSRFPDGAVIPGVVVDDSVLPGPQDVVARGKWAGGHWVLELRRSLKGGPKDIAFADGTMLWFAVFDHSQSRHTYHLRPLIVEMP
ncbi:MAG: ethylbenzene dehydrogenase-related protein [bacterium]